MVTFAHLIYIDDSGDEELCIFSALAIPVEEWRNALRIVKEYRHELSKSDGIHHLIEFHAWKFVSGRGRVSRYILSKTRRCEIFKETLELITTLPGARLFNVCMPKEQTQWAFERLLNRINRTMQAWNSHAILICDEGKESDYTRLCRRMGVFNPIPSRYGIWQDTGETHRNIPIERVIEDPFFKDSKFSYFIQLVDFCGYALLRRERPLPSKTRYGLDKAFNVLSPILVREACRYDPEGIVR